MSTFLPSSLALFRLTHSGNSVDRRIRRSIYSAPPGGAKRPISVSLALRTSMTTAPGSSSASWNFWGDKWFAPLWRGASSSPMPYVTISWTRQHFAPFMACDEGRWSTYLKSTVPSKVAPSIFDRSSQKARAPSNDDVSVAL